MRPASPFQIDPYSPYDDFSISKERTVFIAKYWTVSQLQAHVDKMRSIEELTINAIRGDDTLYSKTKFILNHSTLRTLEISFSDGIEGRSIEPEQMQTLATCLSSHKSLKKFILYNEKISNFKDKQTAEILAKGINASNLQFVGFVNLPEFAFDALFDILSTNRTLRQLYLGGVNGFGSRLDRFVLESNITKLQIRTPVRKDEIASLFNILRNTTRLELFELKIKEWPENFAEICSAIAENKSLKTLIFESMCLNKDSNERLLLILSAVKNHSTIQSFKIGEINSEGLTIIAKHLLENNTSNKLRSLAINRPEYDVYPNAQVLDVEHWKFFSEKLATNTTLKHLFLGKFSLTKSGHAYHPAFIQALIQNTTLLTLDTFPNSTIDHHGIMNLLCNNKTLKTLALKQTYVATDLTSLYEAIMQNQSLTSLDISEMLYHFKEEPKLGEFFGKLIMNNTRLKELKCTGIFDRPRGAPQYYKQIVQRLKYNQSLLRLDLLRKSKTRQESEEKIIADVFSENKTLVKFNDEAIQYRNDWYLKRNREYILDAVVLLHNIFRDERRLLPKEIWLQILQQIGIMSLAIEKIT